MATTPTTEPQKLTQGEIVTWTRTETDFPASDGWALTYYFRGTVAGQAFEVAGSGVGAVHTFTTAAATTASRPAGVYLWQLKAVKTGGARTVASGVLKLEADFSAVNGALDTRSQIQKDLDAVQAAIRERIDTGRSVSEYEVSVGDSTRKLKYFTLVDLQARETFLIGQRNAELAAERAEAGQSAIRPIRVQFGPR